MIKFFSKIRQRMLTENKFSKYLLYAIGEIVLVVIGILIALQINNCNENKKTRQRELIILENIIHDLEKDKIGLTKIIETRISKAASATIMVSYYEGVAIKKLSDYYFHWTNVLYWEVYHPRNIAFKELVNSGNTSIIKNAAIRNTLLDIDASYEVLFTERNHLYDDYTTYLYHHFADIIDYGDGIKVWSNPDIKIELSEEDVAVALKNRAIKNGFTLASFNHILLKDQLTEILKNVEATIVRIHKEIEK